MLSIMEFFTPSNKLLVYLFIEIEREVYSFMDIFESMQTNYLWKGVDANM